MNAISSVTAVLLSIQSVRARPSSRSIGLFAALILHTAGAPPAAQAQFSPRCRLNGREVYCAMTAYGASADGWQKTTVVLADQRMIKLYHNDRNCRLGEPEKETICPARLSINGPKGTQSFFGTYRLRSYEGGVSHRYHAGPVDLEFYYMD